MPERTCSICPRPHKANGLCNGHNERRRLGLPLDTPLRLRAAAGESRFCAHPGCDRPRDGGYAGTRGYHLYCPRCKMRMVRLAAASLTIEQYLAMVTEQGGRCKICAATEPGGGRDMWCVDHDHRCCPGRKSCGRCVRGLLCNRCNRCLGLLGDDPEVLIRAARYLAQSAKSGS